MGMVMVRSSPCPVPNLQRALPYALRAPRSPAASRLPGRTSSRTVCPPFDSRQFASAFNQPLSFDTSSVTNMHQMFVYAGAFNQPLSFDTSSVTTMYRMFQVRSAHALAPSAFTAGPSRRAC